MEVVEVTPPPHAVYDVTVSGDEEKTKHRVTVPQEYYKALTNGNVTPEELVRRSFEYLLARESNTSILSAFELSAIVSYFPEYESKIEQMFKDEN